MDQKPKAYKIVWSVQASSSMKEIFDAIAGESKQGKSRLPSGDIRNVKKKQMNGFYWQRVD